MTQVDSIVYGIYYIRERVKFNVPPDTHIVNPVSPRNFRPTVFKLFIL